MQTADEKELIVYLSGRNIFLILKHIYTLWQLQSADIGDLFSAQVRLKGTDLLLWDYTETFDGLRYALPPVTQSIKASTVPWVDSPPLGPAIG